MRVERDSFYFCRESLVRTIEPFVLAFDRLLLDTPFWRDGFELWKGSPETMDRGAKVELPILLRECSLTECSKTGNLRRIRYRNIH